MAMLPPIILIQKMHPQIFIETIPTLRANGIFIITMQNPKDILILKEHGANGKIQTTGEEAPAAITP